MLIVAAVLGIVAGLRTMMPIAAVAWAAHLGILPVADTPLAFLASAAAAWIATAAAAAELVGDKLPRTPSRTVPMQFGARLVSGALCGAAVAWPLGALAGAVGAVAGTYGGAAARAAMARAFGRDLPAAVIEDAAAIVLAAVAVLAL